MPFSLTLPTRHTDTYAATGFVHAGVLLALTELAYAAYERAAGVEKPAHVVAVQVRTRAEYRTPLPWQDGAIVEVTTPVATARGFTQAFTLRSARSDRLVARVEHDWVWLDTTTGRSVPLPEDVQAAFLALTENPDQPSTPAA
ncbi:MAG: acyl-CoA thioesterase [Dehalococcoidia bacterium]